MAAPSATSRPRPSRDVSDTDDVVLSRALEISAWAQRNARLVVGVAVVLLVLVGGILYWRYIQAEARDRAALEYMRIEPTVLSGNTQLATRDLQQFIARNAGTPAAEEARLALARLQLDADQAAAAVVTLDGAAAGIGDSPVGAATALLLASAQEQAGDAEAAVVTYLRVADAAELEYERQQALESAAAVHERGGNPAAAAELYRRLLDGAEADSPRRALYEMRLQEAEAAARAGA